MENRDEIEKIKSYKFHASSVGKLLTNGRGGRSLSLTTQSYLDEVFVELVFARKKIITTSAMRKGTEQEDQSIEIVNRVLGTNFSKNEKYFQNDFVCGYPDIITDDEIIDIKTSQDIWSFMRSSGSKLYEAQLQAYMWLTGKERARLAYCLTDSPEWMVQDQIRKAMWNMGALTDEDPEFEEIRDQIFLNNSFSDIPDNLRVKFVYYERDEELIEKIKTKIEQARDYMIGLYDDLIFNLRK